MKLLYITDSCFLRNEANLVQTYNTVSALEKKCEVEQLDFVINVECTPKYSEMVKEYELISSRKATDKISFFPVLKQESSFYKTIFSMHKVISNLELTSYDLVYTRSRIALIYFSLIGFKNFCYEAHALITPGAHYKRLLYKRAIKHTPKVITPINNRLIKDFSSEFGVKKERMELIPCSARVFNGELKPLKERSYIAFCGSSYPGKGLDEVINLAHVLKDENFLIIARSSDRINTLKSSIPSNVTLHLDIPNTEVYDLLQDVKIALAPYQNEAKTSGGYNNIPYLSPLKVFEYFAFSCLVVSSDIEAIREVIDNEKTGLLFENGNDNDLLNKVNRALDLIDQGHGEQIAKSAFDRFKKEYSYDVRAKKIIDLKSKFHKS